MIRVPSNFAAAAAWVREQEVGRDATIRTPFGERRICYADLTATGRHLEAVESWLARLRPYYANTHTEISSTGRLMSRLREGARQAIRRAVGAGTEDEVVFVGSGATAAVNKLVGLLGLKLPEPLEREHGLGLPAAARPVVFVGPYEHHSNELPWVESIADVVEIGLDARGAIDLADLERRLAEYAGRPLRIGSFSAASNVTGVLSDTRALSRTLHRAGALAFFDYAAAAPYVPIDMHPPDPDERIDALFLSPHKFVGGPEASGVLVARRDLFRTRTPERPGGGTVDYVSGSRREDVDYVDRLAEREEGGTPAIFGDLRAGMAFLIKDAVGAEGIRDHEIAIAARAAERLARHPRIRVLGPVDLARLAIVPVHIEGLHHDLASILLDHLFGIQNRAGCSCAGPYGHRLLGIDPGRSQCFREQVRRGVRGIKPGWVRLSLPWYAAQEDLDFMLTALEFVAERGLDFVPLYELDWRSGVWRHLDEHDGEAAAFRLGPDGWSAPDSVALAGAAPEALAADRSRYLVEARERADELRRRWEQFPPSWNPTTGDPTLDELIWFRFVHAA